MSLVIGTAGHIDHGKTSLVKALTGMDLDRLPEEQERGITLALGFAWLDLPDGGPRVSFVDVPGHEKLVATMVSGATGFDGVLLCVSAAEGAMPQTREHLAILDLLGVQQGAVVLTMVDLVDPELVELAAMEIREVVAGTFLDGKPIVACSARTGAGRDELLAVLRTFVAPPRPTGGAFRLPIDRRFLLEGFGGVVTGTVTSGIVAEGDTVQIAPSGLSARVRSLQVHGEPAAEGVAGQRLALNLAGVDAHQIHRGDVVVKGEVAESPVLDVIYTHLGAAPMLPDGSAVTVLHGTAERTGHLHLAQDQDLLMPGESGPAQLRLDGPVVGLPGDRLVVRRTSPVETLGGAVLVDPWAPRMRTRDRVAHGQAILKLSQGDVGVWLDRAGEEGLPLLGYRSERVREVGVQLGDRLVHRSVALRLDALLLEAMAHFHAQQPLALGANRHALRGGRLQHLGDKAFEALLGRLTALSHIEVQGSLVRIAGFAVRLTPAQEKLAERLTAAVRDEGLAGVEPSALIDAHPGPETPALVHLLETRGTLRAIAGLGWVAADQLEGLVQIVRLWFSDHPELSTQDFKEITNLTRKSAIPLLEWLDQEKRTKRVPGGERIPGSLLGGSAGVG